MIWVVFAILLFHSVFLISGHHVPCQGMGDAANYIVPLKLHFFQLLHTQHIIPTWTDMIYGGIPLDCVVSGGYFSPFNWIFAWLPPIVAMNLCMIAGWLISAFGLWKYGEVIGLTRLPRALTTVTFCLSSWMFFSSQDHFFTLIWLPLGFYFTHVYASKTKVWALVLLAGVVGLQLLAGHIPKAVFSVMGYTLYFAFFSWKSGGSLGTFSKKTALFLIALALGFGLAAIQLIPASAFFAETTRGHYGLSLNLVGSGHPFTVLEWLIPGLFSFTNWGLLGTYLGLIPFFLFMVSFRLPRSPVWFSLMGLFVFSTLYALGAYIPLFKVIQFIPVLKGFRMPIYIMIMGIFSVSVLAGFGLQSLLDRTSRFPRKLTVLFLLIGILPFPMGMALHVLQPSLLELGRDYIQTHFLNHPPHFHTLTFYMDKLTTQLSQVRGNLGSVQRLISPLCFFVFIFGLMAYRKQKISLMLFSSLTVFFVVFDLSAWKPFSQMTHYKDLMAPTPIISYLQTALKSSSQPFRVYQWITEDTLKKFSDANADTLVLDKTMQIAYLNLLFQIPVVDISGFGHILTRNNVYLNRLDGQLLGGFGESTALTDTERRNRFYQNLSLLADYTAKFIVSPEPLSHPTLAFVLKDHGTYLYQNLSVRPYLQFPYACKILHQTETSLLIETQSPQQAALVRSENNLPGWTATLDKHPIPIYLANTLFQGIDVPAGSHKIQFRYQTPRGKWGRWVSGLALLVLIGSFIGSFHPWKVGRRR